MQALVNWKRITGSSGSCGSGHATSSPVPIEKFAIGLRAGHWIPTTWHRLQRWGLCLSLPLASSLKFIESQPPFSILFFFFIWPPTPTRNCSGWDFSCPSPRESEREKQRRRRSPEAGFSPCSPTLLLPPPRSFRRTPLPPIWSFLYFAHRYIRSLATWRCETGSGRRRRDELRAFLMRPWAMAFAWGELLA